MSAFIKQIAQLEQCLGYSLPHVKTDFPLKVPLTFVTQIKQSATHEALLAQVLPVEAENTPAPGYQQDAVGDLKAQRDPALLQKYHGRALLMASPRCHIHCRFCFRRHFPYEQSVGQAALEQALTTLKEDTQLHEVILSGGDPLTLSEGQLLSLCKRLEEISHIRTLRIHSRSPIIAPDHCPQEKWLAWAAQSRLNIVLVTHCNHADELNETSAALLKQWRQAGITLLNQSVLLKGVNDDETTLETLSHALWAHGILPYYLHQLDKVVGAAHFEVSDQRARQLLQYLRSRLPGYLVPKLVREIPGTLSKTPVEAS